MSLLAVKGLCKSFHADGSWGGKGHVTRAVDDVSFEIKEGETLAIVGESGSGKSTTARIVMRLLDADAGNIVLMGKDMTRLKGKHLREMRKHMQMVFQDPFASLNPRMRIGETVGEGLRVHARGLNAKQRREKVTEVLEHCGMGTEVLDRYPHQFSGGQRQRIGIGRALAVSPRLLVLDEPVSALDVSVQAQILNLLRKLQSEQKLAYLFISHDLSVVRQVADRVAVMFAGRIVEQGCVEDIYAQPKHPYTRALLNARPVEHPAKRKKQVDYAVRNEETIAESGCVFRLRCPCAQRDCEAFDGLLSGDAHAVACLHPLNPKN
ncbi:MAG: ATP-binding cassette domain-containing protein [Mariprofundaceae bacterium]|nr:ATP-binding cassette domain-containing protein [Mariprofundaceae bacterium]